MRPLIKHLFSSALMVRLKRMASVNIGALLFFFMAAFDLSTLKFLSTHGNKQLCNIGTCRILFYAGLE